VDVYFYHAGRAQSTHRLRAGAALSVNEASRWQTAIVTAEAEEIEAADVIAGNFLLLN
jgi:hypothetical protein